MIEPHDVDLNLLSVFQEVYRERQISGAARRLGLSQSAVSNALARLRRLFGDELFVRTGQGMQPTPFAEGLAEKSGWASLSLHWCQMACAVCGPSSWPVMPKGRLSLRWVQ